MQQAQINRLSWRSRRGLLELDLLLVPFMKAQFVHLNPQLQSDYGRLLDQEDLDIYDWIQRRCTQPSEFVSVLVEIRQFHAL